MLKNIILYSIQHKLIILLFVLGIVGFGIFSLMNISIGAVPDITNNQVQVITTSRNLATEDIEKFVTAPVELEMANLPGVKEIRSISKFGLSVVTIVFEDRLGTYLPRQLIAEKIKSAEEKIPQGFGTPFMGPVSTGLGEIYQYILDIKPGYENKYSVMDLRTIQDWIVKRQLSGIQGVVEVNTWGGYLKTYEVAIHPHTLRAVDLSLNQVYEALESNNSVAGGGYIEKTNESYFVRAEGLLGSLEDIENIVITTKNGNPIFIKDVADVNFGHATRFGAITGNGEGEKVLGQVMMLKGAAGKEVIENVKERVAAIQSSLPEGVFINPFLERSELIGKTTFTIAENLILGCLIVIFVVILLLGNLRSGLVVASVIPLSLLFAISMMYIFGVDANLMSLGAIDFGIIIDGAVIIVEYIAFKITAQSQELIALNKEEQQEKIDQISFQSTNKMMHSAIFGQLIIIIVFIPILSLTGVEGKMFSPMAKTFSFAIIGTMIFCFTYVPVMAALFIKPRREEKDNISAKFVKFLQRLYEPIIRAALNAKALILSLALIMLIGAGYLFSTMGGEFVPTLDEGDFVIQPVLKTGMSLAETVNMTTRMEKIIKRFPEVKQVVSRIGAAEVPTDPMSMEESDIIITLNPIKTWENASSKDELADIFKDALIEEIPGVEIEFTQPIEMRFNELITGVRADLAIKLFGEDLDILNKKGQEIKRAVENIEGAADVTMEKTAGLPQISIKYDRSKMARYGVKIDELNQVISMGFAGLSAGQIFEGEKQFDLVIRYDKEHREELDHVKNAMLTTADGRQLPLETFADITYSTGPAKISRDDTKRRVVVGVNVRGRDLQSVVDDAKAAIESNVDLPPGYIVTYGGQFENLQNAINRLSYAVPLSLILIFILLYFAFGSVKDALIIYSAIPLSAVGGILFLYIRGMPFSISAGVGFIALFGIAVLNGIVLIEHFKELKASGFSDVNERIVKGTKERLRPVLLTAFAAALGFLPMAISTSAGAEVQKPLATVVIGGLISATLLTLIVLPVLYSLFDRKRKHKNPAGVIGILLFLILPFFGSSQNVIDLQQAKDLAIENNLLIKNASLEIEKSKALINASNDIPKTGFNYSYDANNIAENNRPLHVLGVAQEFSLPGIYKAKKALSKLDVSSKMALSDLNKWQLEYEVEKAFYSVQYYSEIIEEYNSLDSLINELLLATKRKVELGDGSKLELISLNSKKELIELDYQKAEQNKEIALLYLKYLIQSTDDFQVENKVTLVEEKQVDLENHPLIKYRQTNFESAIQERRIMEKEKLPDFQFSVFGGMNSFSDSRVYPGVELGIGLPIFSKAYNARIKSAEINSSIKNNELFQQEIELNNYKAQLLKKHNLAKEALSRYEIVLLKNRNEMLNSSKFLFENGEINYFEFLKTLESAVDIKLNYLMVKQEYNMTQIELNYLIDNY